VTNVLISIVLALLALHRVPDIRSARVRVRGHLPSLTGQMTRRVAAVLYGGSADDSNDAKKENDPKKNDPPGDPRPPDPHPKPPPPPPPPPRKPPPPSCHRDDDCDQQGRGGLVWTAGNWVEGRN
jgi:hypothetical protein